LDDAVSTGFVHIDGHSQGFGPKQSDHFSEGNDSGVLAVRGGSGATEDRANRRDEDIGIRLAVAHKFGEGLGGVERDVTALSSGFADAEGTAVEGGRKAIEVRLSGVKLTI
jgi:hypothetical protein